MGKNASLMAGFTTTKTTTTKTEGSSLSSFVPSFFLTALSVEPLDPPEQVFLPAGLAFWVLSLRGLLGVVVEEAVEGVEAEEAESPEEE